MHYIIAQCIVGFTAWRRLVRRGFLFFSWLMIRVTLWQNQILPLSFFMLLLLSYTKRVPAAASSIQEYEPPLCKHVDFLTSPNLDLDDFHRLWMWKGCLCSAVSYKLLPKDSVLAGHEGSYWHSPTFFALYSSSGSDICQGWWQHVKWEERRNRPGESKREEHTEARYFRLACRQEAAELHVFLKILT